MSPAFVPSSRQSDIVIQELKGELLIYDLRAHRVFCLNETSALIWQSCDGTKSVTQISQALSKKLNKLVDEDLVWLALDQLKEENLLSNTKEFIPEFDGMSRRQIIKKVGLGAMIALPIISSLTAPKAIHAQSGICANPACTCTLAANCTFPAGCACSQQSTCTAACPNGCSCLVANGTNSCNSTCQA